MYILCEIESCVHDRRDTYSPGMRSTRVLGISGARLFGDFHVSADWYYGRWLYVRTQSPDTSLLKSPVIVPPLSARVSARRPILKCLNHSLIQRHRNALDFLSLARRSLSHRLFASVVNLLSSKSALLTRALLSPFQSFLFAGLGVSCARLGRPGLWSLSLSPLLLGLRVIKPKPPPSTSRHGRSPWPC